MRPDFDFYNLQFSFFNVFSARGPYRSRRSQLGGHEAGLSAMYAFISSWALRISPSYFMRVERVSCTSFSSNLLILRRVNAFTQSSDSLMLGRFLRSSLRRR